MAYNRTVEVALFETGFIIHAYLYDDNGQLQDLSAGGAWTVNIKATKKGPEFTTNLLSGTTMVIQNQVSDKGGVKYTMTANDVGGVSLPVTLGRPYTDYDLIISATDPTGRVHKFPKSGMEAAFGTLRILASK